MTSIKHAARQKWLLYFVLVGFLIVIAFPFYLDHQRANRESSDLQCIANWANSTTARSERIIGLSNAKNKATDDLFRAVAAKNTKQFNDSLNEYLTASNALNNALKLNPIPPAPQFTCLTGKIISSPSGVVVTETAPGGVIVTTTTARPSGTTQTITEPLPTTVTAPGVPMPGRTVTITITITPKPRTVTKTVMPPDCLKTLTLPCLLTIPIPGG